MAAGHIGEFTAFRLELIERMKKGDEIELQIEDITSSGWGVGRAHDESGSSAVVFVPGTAPGEKAAARITECRKNHYRGELVQLTHASPDRRTPPCRFFGACPGCSLQFLAYEAQCEARMRRVERILSRASGNLPAHVTAVRSPKEFGYRTHVSVATQRSGSEVAIGFTDPDTRRVVDISECLLIPQWGNKALGQLRRSIARAAEKPEGEFRLRLFFDHPSQRTYVVNPRGPLKMHRHVSSALDEVLAGFPDPQTVKREVDGVTLRIHPASFIQANYYLGADLYRRARDMAGVRIEDMVLELYAGSGFFTLAFARTALKTMALEADRRACDNLAKSAEEVVRAARKAKEREPDIGIFQGKAESLTDKIMEEFAPSVVIANPPRSGLHKKVLESIAGCAKVRRVVMISCDPSTCSRDMKGLSSAGFAADDAVVLDCYPQTAHVEMIVALAR